MKKHLTSGLVIMLLMLLQMGQLMAQPANKEKIDEDKLVVLWTSDDPYLAERVAFMYTHAAKRNNWFKDVTLIIWGPSAKLTSENLKIQQKLHAMQKDGIKIRACIACANAYNVSDKLKDLGLEVAGMGVPLTKYLKDGSTKVLTF